jgi:peroxiredoxin family protein
VPSDTLGILLISGGHERAHYAFVLASGAAAVGRDVVIFATNQGCRALLDDLSEFAGEEDEVAAKGVGTLIELREASIELGVRLIACEAGLRLSGIATGLAEHVEVAGAVTFLEATQGGQVISL